MSEYVVTGACAYLTTISPLDGKPYKTLLYQGSLVPDSALESEIEHNLAAGLIGPTSVIADQDQVLLLEPAPVVVPEPEGDDLDDWRLFAISKGAELEEIGHLSADELRERFGSKPDGDGNVVLEEPARNASTEAWLEFALAKGAELEDVQSLKRDELIELFGTHTGS